MRPILEINEPEFEAEVLKCARPVLVNFWAGWSKCCNRSGCVIDEVAEACGERAKVVKVNVDENPLLGTWYGVKSIPTLLCFVNGEVRERVVGTASKEEILEKFKPYIGLS